MKYDEAVKELGDALQLKPFSSKIVRAKQELATDLLSGLHGILFFHRLMRASEQNRERVEER